MAFADYEIQIDTVDKKVYLISGEVKISVENVGEYFVNNASIGGSWDVGDSSFQTPSSTQNDDTAGTGEDTSMPSAFSGTVLKELGSWTELEKAIYWMYENGLTMYDTTSSYRPNDLVTREEAAKLIGQLFEVLVFEQTDKGFNCAFTDAAKFDPTLASHIAQVCKRGIFRGNDKTQEYMPHDNLTKGQILAVLTRILEGKLSDETATPRWIEYYVKMKQIGITNETNLANIDLPSTRGEMALLIYRFKNLIVLPDGNSNLDKVQSQLSGDFDAMLQQLLIQRKLANPDNPLLPTGDSSWEGNSGTGGLDLDLIAGNTPLSSDPEFNEAIRWMYDVGITNYNTPDTYLPFQTITREQVAKMLDKFALATQLNVIRNASPCSFSDVPSTSEFSTHIRNVCQYGVMNGANGKFNPQQTVTKAEFITMLIRLFEGKSLDETVSPRRMNYYQRAIDLSLISAQDTVTFNQPIARYEIAIFLYRLKVRLTMYSNLNDTILANEIVRTLEDTTWPEDTKKSGKIYVDILALNNAAFKGGYVEVFGERYQVQKSVTNTYNVGDNSFVWYGELLDLATEQEVGTITFIITNGALTEGAIRFATMETSYYISKDAVTTTHYWLREV